MSHRAVYKSTTAEFLDDFYSGESRPLDEAFDDASNLLDSADSILDTTRVLEERSMLPSGSVANFDEYWLSGSAGKPGSVVARVIRSGYQEAIALARARGVPIENFWVTGAGPDFELHICSGERQITVLMFIPGEDARPYGSERAETNSWVVRVDDLDDVDARAPRVTLDDGEPPVYKIQLSGALPAAT